MIFGIPNFNLTIMNNQTIFEYVFGPESLMTLSEKLYYKNCEEIALSLDTGEIEQLQSLVESGPMCDDETLSSRIINQLIDRKLVIKIVVEGEDGYNACTHTGAWVYRYLKHFNSEK